MATSAAALFATDQGPVPAIWIWPGGALTTRLIAVMLFTIAAGAWIARGDATLAALMNGAIAIYGGTAVVANVVNYLESRPYKPAYVVVFGAMAIVSAALWWRQRRQRLAG